MQKIIYFLFLFGLLILSACQHPAVVNSEIVVAATNDNSNKIENSQPVLSATPKMDSIPVKIKSEYPLLWATNVNIRDFTDTADPLELFSYDENQYEKPPDEKSPYYQARSGVEVDLLNCGGYLASGRLYSSNEKSNFPPPNWRIKIAPATIAKDVEAKIKRCNIFTPEDVATGEAFTSSIFAVAPQKDARRNITVGETDTKKIFRSLPKEIREFLNAKAALAAGRTRDDLSVSQGDNWTDLDGDGQIDLIDVSASNEKQSSGVVLLLVKGKWKVISRTQPA